jgi:hypothetical protein
MGHPSILGLGSWREFVKELGGSCRGEIDGSIDGVVWNA